MTTNNNIREIEEPKDADNTSVYEPRIPSDWSLEQILINYRTSAADLAQRAERGELVTTEEIKKVDDRTYQAITALQNKAVISELKQIEPPIEYVEYARLAGSEHCTICGFNAVKFRKHIEEKIAQLQKGNSNDSK